MIAMWHEHESNCSLSISLPVMSGHQQVFERQARCAERPAAAAECALQHPGGSQGGGGSGSNPLHRAHHALRHND